MPAPVSTVQVERSLPNSLNFSTTPKSPAPLAQTVIPFGRALQGREWDKYERTVTAAKAALGVNNLALITPIRSLPTDVDTGMGNLVGAEGFFKFAKRLGFNQFQIDPDGATSRGDKSPYSSDVFSSSPLQVHLPSLETPEYGELLPKGTAQGIADRNPNRGTNRVPYDFVYGETQKALRTAYETFKTKQSELSEMSDEFARFKTKNRFWLEPYAMYEVLSERVYGNDYPPNWHGGLAELDRMLYSEKASAAAPARIHTLKATYPEDFESYQFTQFLASQQKAKMRQKLSDLGLGLKADRQVGMSNRDNWVFQDLVMPDWSLGCPPDYFNDQGQAWPFMFIHPKHIYDDRGFVDHTKRGTQLLTALFDKLFEENKKGARIDHTIGIVDPWVYPAGAGHTKDGTRLFSSPDHPVMGEFSRVQAGDINESVTRDDADRVKPEAMTHPDVEKRYAGIIDEIIMPAARRAGIAKEDLIFEDLGAITNPTKAVMENRKLSAIRVTQFVNVDKAETAEEKDLHRGKNVPDRHWVTTGTHDNPALLKWIHETFFKTTKNPTKLRQRDAHFDRLKNEVYGQMSATRRGMVGPLDSVKAVAKAMYTELFTSPAQNKQIFFGDWLGNKENYNEPGHTKDNFWTLRIPHQYEKAYFKAVKREEGLNLPEVLLQAIRAKNLDADGNVRKLVRPLNELAGILKE